MALIANQQRVSVGSAKFSLSEAVFVSVFLYWSFALGSITGVAQEVPPPEVIESPTDSPPMQAELEQTVENQSLVEEPSLTDLAPSRNDVQPNGNLRFSFSGARWREVLDWLAESGDLALHFDSLPTGSFTYSDNESFTVNGAISRLNLFLIPQGYVAVRRGRLLTVITLGDQRSLQQLDAIADTVTLEQLEELDSHEVVKCFIPLGETLAADAIAELQPLSLMTPPVTLPKSNQLMVTETAGKLRNVVRVIAAIEAPESTSVVRSFSLKHVNAETVLMVAGGHLGIPRNETSGLDITITTDLSGKTLFAVGDPAKVDRLSELLKVLDVAKETNPSNEPSELVSHRVTGNNLQTVYDVLQTILAGESLRLSKEASTNSIVAFAPPRVQRTIEQTIAELQSPGFEFSIIDLNGIDPYFAISLINEMFGLSEEQNLRSSADSRERSGNDRGQLEKILPRVDADPSNGRLFVRATSAEIEQIEALIERLGQNTASASNTRLIPLSKANRTEVLRAAKQWWSDQGILRVVPMVDQPSPESIERVFHQPKRDTAESLSAVEFDGEILDDADDLDQGCESCPEVVSQLVPEGILIQSEDIASLDRVENYIRSLSIEANQAISPPVIYYLKYVKAEEAVKMLADLLDGANSLQTTPGSDLIKGTAFNYGGYFGSSLLTRDGTTTVIAGTATIVSDARLNRLILQGTAADVAMVDQYLKIIDKQSSLTEIETTGKTHIIELQHTKATDVAAMIQSAFPDRILESTTTDAPGRRGEGTSVRDEAQRSDNPQSQPDQSNDRERIPSPEKPTRGSEAKMTVAVHEPSNSLVITAPDELFDRVRDLVDEIDQQSEQIVEVIAPRAGVDLETILKTLSGDETPSARGSNASTRNASGRSSENNRRREGQGRRQR